MQDSTHRAFGIAKPAPIIAGCPAFYGDASDDQVLANYEGACAAEVAHHDAGESTPDIVKSTCDEWMREGIRRGIL
jgi:hypothetical protein